ncbi:hypothetical protein G6F59_014093 [Rhizopus arrhizus]|nr:hypothetical protein G6F59_014093 [Rhizopus arrhizus]
MPPEKGGRDCKPELQRVLRLPAGAASRGAGWHSVRVPWRAVRGGVREHIRPNAEAGFLQPRIARRPCSAASPCSLHGECP